MSNIKTGKELAAAAINVAQHYKTLYVMGCFGAPMTAENKKRYTNNHSYNKQSDRTNMINAASSDTFGFDCVCLIKGLLWGWNGDKNKRYGGATYASNGVPDIGEDLMINRCSDISTDFSNIKIGEVVWMKGHIGIYVGDGLAVECTPKWKNCVQITSCNCFKSGYSRRNWTKHGRLPYVSYEDEICEKAQIQTEKPSSASSQLSVGDIVTYTGNVHYSSANSTAAKNCKGGKAKITRIYQLGKSKHPYHLIHSASGCTVYGWVDEKFLKK